MSDRAKREADEDLNSDLIEQEREAVSAARLARLVQGEPEAAAGEEALAILPRSGRKRIVGGQETLEFPDCCAVGNQQGYYCSGTLIAPTLVVTAAHCRAVTRVFLKGSDITHPEEGVEIPVVKQIFHPTQDLSVLVLKDAAPGDITPRHVAQGKEVKGRRTLLVGFGTVNFQGTIGYGKKRMVEVPIRSIRCSTHTAQTNYGCRDDTEMVAGHRGLMKDSCHGDSGGPAYIKSSTGEYYLLGATSRGISDSDVECGDGGIYVRVDKCLDWIRQVTGIDN
jgi:hypothetical protein